MQSNECVYPSDIITIKSRGQINKATVHPASVQLHVPNQRPLTLMMFRSIKMPLKIKTLKRPNVDLDL